MPDTLLDLVNSETKPYLPPQEEYESLREQVLFSEPENFKDRFNRARLGFQLGTQGTSIAEERQRVLQNKQAIQEAKQKQAEVLFDDMMNGLNTVKSIEDPKEKMKMAKLIGKQLSRRDKEAGLAFSQIADEPAATATMLDPKAVELFGGTKQALKVFTDDPSKFNQVVVDLYRNDVVSKLFNFLQENPDRNIDLNQNGEISTNEARAWLKKNPDNPLSFEEMNVVALKEFEPLLADVFGAQTETAIEDSQKAGLKKAVNQMGELVFATEAQIKADPNLKPEPAAPLVSFGGDKMRESLFESSIKRRDELRNAATQATQQRILAQQMREIAPGINTGTGAETITALQSLGGVAARLTGNEALADKIQDTADAETLRSLNAQAVSTLIRTEKGGPVSNSERAQFVKVFPGLANSPTGNIALSHIVEAKAISQEEQFAFYDKIVNDITSGRRQSDVGADKAYSEYVNDLPRTTGSGESIRAIDDGENLWQYYLNGRPDRWVFSGGEFTLEQVKEVAEKNNIPVRQFIATAKRKGSLLGVK